MYILMCSFHIKGRFKSNCIYNQLNEAFQVLSIPWRGFFLKINNSDFLFNQHLKVRTKEKARKNQS